MKKVKMKVNITSADWSYAYGQVVEIDDDLADAWVEGGNAELVGGEENGEKKGKSSDSSDKRGNNAGGSKKSSKS